MVGFWIHIYSTLPSLVLDAEVAARDTETGAGDGFDGITSFERIIMMSGKSTIILVGPRSPPGVKTPV